jgi:hypothetical protein
VTATVDQRSAGGDRSARLPISSGDGPAPRRDIGRFGPSLVAIACLVAVWSVLLPRWFHYQLDDIWEFSLAHSEGLSWKFVTVNGFEDFGPITRINHWAEWAISPLNIELGTATAVAFVTLLLLSVMWLIDELDVPARRRIPLLVVGGLALPLFSIAAWNDAAVYIVPTLAATYAVMASHARGLRTGSQRFHLLACGFMIIAVGLQERGGIAVALTVLMDVFVLGRGQPWSGRVRRLWQVRWWLSALIAIAAVDAIIWRLFYIWPGQRPANLVTGAKVISSAFGQYLLPSFFGLQSPLEGALLWIVAIVVLAGIIFFARRDRRTLDLVAFFVLTFLLYYVGLLFSPELVNGVKVNASAAQYLVYVVFPLLIILALLGSPATDREKREPGAQRGSHRRVGPMWPRWTLMILVTFGAALFLIAQDVHSLDGDFSYAPALQNFYSNVRAGQGAWSSKSVALLPLQIPKTAVSAWASAWGQEENFLSVVDPGRPGSPGQGHFSVITDHGQVRPVAAKVTAVIPAQELVDTSSGTATRASQSAGMCVALNSDSGWMRFAVPHQQSQNGRLFVALAYSAVGTASVQMTTVSSDGSFHENTWPTTITTGRHVAVYPLDGRTFDSVQFSSLSGHARVCVSGAAVVKPVWTTAGAGCSVVDDYGGVGPATPCGTVVDSTRQLSALINAPS